MVWTETIRTELYLRNTKCYANALLNSPPQPNMVGITPYDTTTQAASIYCSKCGYYAVATVSVVWEVVEGGDNANI